MNSLILHQTSQTTAKECGIVSCLLMLCTFPQRFVCFDAPRVGFCEHGRLPLLRVAGMCFSPHVLKKQYLHGATQAQQHISLLKSHVATAIVSLRFPAVCEKRLEHTEVDPATGAKLCFVIEGKYNTVGIRAETSSPLMQCGGLMAGRVQMLDNLQSMEKTCSACTQVIAPHAAADRVHALVCGSNSPHAVTFSGANAQTHTFENGEETTLLHSQADELTISAIFDEGRIQKLHATQRGVEAFKAEWTEVARAAWRRRLIHCTQGTFGDCHWRFAKRWRCCCCCFRHDLRRRGRHVLCKLDGTPSDCSNLINAQSNN